MANRRRNNGPVNVEGAQVEVPEVEGTEDPEVEGTGAEVEVPEVEGTEGNAEAGEGTGDVQGHVDEAAAAQQRLMEELAALPLHELTARMKTALNEADIDLVHILLPLIEAKGTEAETPAATRERGRTGTDVKRWVAQFLVDMVAEKRDEIAAGPADAPFTADEAKVAVAAAANILGYLPGQNQLTWPESLGERTGRGRGRRTADSE